MEIRDIVNRDIVNLTNCEHEPIHVPGSIQPHGFLLGLKASSLNIEFCSGNTAVYLNLAHTQLLGKSFAEVFGDDNVQKLKQYIDNGLMLSDNLLHLTLVGADFQCTVHKNEQDIYVLDVEPLNFTLQEANGIYDHSSRFLQYMRDTHTLKELCQLVAEGTRAITGYDRVMIYRFDRNYNGEVFAESRREDLEPFLGLHYPHTDIPAQARELYLKSFLRLITDINYTPVPIYTIDDAPDKNLDLTFSLLRSVSPIHVQYLQNMGVGATMTLSLIHRKKLWGLIACHHYSPKNLSPAIRLASQLQGHFITSQIDVRQASEEYEYAKKANLALEKLNRQQLQKEEDLQSFVDNPDMLALCNASGVSIQFNGHVYKNGLTPDEKQIKELASWATAYSNHSRFNTEKLIEHLPSFKNISPDVSGIIYHSLSIHNDNCIIWYRPETKSEVNWGGDPSQSIIKDKNGLSPRRSFAIWKEIVDSTSKPWLNPDLETVSLYANSLQRQLSLFVTVKEEEKYRKLSELLKDTNNELENINWISTHDLQEPLRKIQLMASRLLMGKFELTETVRDSVNRMNASAIRMQTLLADILQYKRLNYTDEPLVLLNVSALLDEVKLDLEEIIAEKGAEIYISEMPKVMGVPFLLKQLFSNLIVNSIKYSHPNRKPEIWISKGEQNITYEKENTGNRYNVICVLDNGRGFDSQYAEKIFNIFTRLHTEPELRGSGVGLALCKKIMQNLMGHISATSKVDEGTVISLYFPVEIAEPNALE